MHDVGHVVGLDDTRRADPREVMYPQLTRQPARWGRAIWPAWIVGAGGGSLPDVT
jgi:hypothetical protein